MYPIVWFFIVITCAGIMAAFGGWVASQKGRESVEGACLGLFFGPFGVLIEALLPSRKTATRSYPHKNVGRSVVGHGFGQDEVEAWEERKRREEQRASDPSEEQAFDYLSGPSSSGSGK